MQLSFDFYYDDEFEIFCEHRHINHNLAKFIVLIPEIMLIMDTLLKFITGFYLNGVVVTEKHIIVEHYLKKGLFYDLLAYFPVVMQGILRKYIETLYMSNLIIKLIQLLMFCKIKRVSIALSNFQEVIASKGKNDYILSAIRSLLIIMFITHLNACSWHAVGYFNNSDETWLKNSGVNKAEWPEKYLVSMYWSGSVFAKVGFGESFIPKNNWEYIHGFGSIIISVAIFGYALNAINEIYEMMSMEEKNYKYKGKKYFY